MEGWGGGSPHDRGDDNMRDDMPQPRVRTHRDEATYAEWLQREVTKPRTTWWALGFFMLLVGSSTLGVLIAFGLLALMEML